MRAIIITIIFEAFFSTHTHTHTNWTLGRATNWPFLVVRLPKLSFRPRKRPRWQKEKKKSKLPLNQPTNERIGRPPDWLFSSAGAVRPLPHSMQARKRLAPDSRQNQMHTLRNKCDTLPSHTNAGRPEDEEEEILPTAADAPAAAMAPMNEPHDREGDALRGSTIDLLTCSPECDQGCLQRESSVQLRRRTTDGQSAAAATMTTNQKKKNRESG